MTHAQTLEARPFAEIPISTSTLEQATQWICEMAMRPENAAIDIHLANAYTIALTSRDHSYKQVLVGSSAVFPDGKPLEWLTKRTKKPLSQVRGPSLFEAVMDRSRATGIRHFLLGGSEETLSKLTAALEQRHPGLDIAGQFSPPFRKIAPEELAQQDEAIQRSGAHIVWVGLGTPRQDHEAQRIARSLGCVAIAVGAAFDFSAGTKPTAPLWMSRVGLEWLFRLATEPRRLWRRYLFGNFEFIRLASIELLKAR